MSRLKQKQSQRQSLSPQQIIQANLLQLNISALENRILDELESNPVLDQSLDNEDEETLSEQEEVDYEDDPDEYEPANIYDNKNKEDRDIPIAEQIDFIEGLVNQLIGLNLKEWEQAIAEEILWNLDQNGYLRVEPILIADRFNQSENAVKQVLNKVQKLDPAGIAALNLQDCLMIQLRGKEQTIAYQIISEYFDDFANHRYDNLQKQLDIDKDILGEIIEEIRTLNPRPGEGKIGIASEVVTPDILAVQRDSLWKVIVNDSWIPELNLNNQYVQMLNQKDISKETQNYLNEKFNAASWFIQAIEQRRNTLTLVMKAIINRQPAFFDGKVSSLIPMKLQDIADDIKMDISTISRSTRGKYVDTPYGIFELKSFFTESYTLESGKAVSTSSIKNLLKELIKEEKKDSPLTDTDLADKLKLKGFPVARRTVAKYREQLQFPVARLRRELNH
ncbi:MAG: RNA polymerase factor sigma-54 [Candidatus Marinimicrobia bacterium]|nr:RNA polymerase factor sigma-54 [Candidatus Neomarinimicrobiota bacterium]MDG2367206.1 RNA polymerase factor sigma-54 [Candidatus Neomarinimicrobiota bacterium]